MANGDVLIKWNDYVKTPESQGVEERAKAAGAGPEVLNAISRARRKTKPKSELLGIQEDPTLDPNALIVPTEPIIQPTQTLDQSYFRDLQDAITQKRIAALDKSRKASLTGLDAEKANVAPTFYNKRNEAAARTDIGAMNFAQFMASRGIKGRAGAMPEIYRNAGLQNQIGALDQQETATNVDIERRRSGVNNVYESDVAGASADAEAQAQQAYLEQVNRDRVYNQEERTYSDNKTQNNLDNQVKTIGAYANDYQAEINRRSAIDPNDPLIPYLQAARNQKIADQEVNNAKSVTLQQEQMQKQRDDALTLWKVIGRADANISNILGVPVGAMTADYNMDSIKTNYDIKKPYYNPDGGATATKEDLYNKISIISTDLDSMSKEEAYNELTKNSGVYIDDIGPIEYDRLKARYRPASQTSLTDLMKLFGN